MITSVHAERVTIVNQEFLLSSEFFSGGGGIGHIYFTSWVGRVGVGGNRTYLFCFMGRGGNRTFILLHEWGGE